MFGKRLRQGYQERAAKEKRGKKAEKALRAVNGKNTTQQPTTNDDDFSFNFRRSSKSTRERAPKPRKHFCFSSIYCRLTPQTKELFSSEHKCFMKNSHVSFL